jgi:hypothetical protein
MEKNTSTKPATISGKHLLAVIIPGAAFLIGSLLLILIISAQAIYRLLPDQTLDYIQAKTVASGEFRNSIMSAAWNWDVRAKQKIYREAIMSLGKEFDPIDCQRIEEKERNECLLLKRNISTVRSNADFLINSTAGDINDPRIKKNEDGLAVIVKILDQAP